MPRTYGVARNNVDQVILAGTAANLCVESICATCWNKAEVAVVRHALAPAAEGDGHRGATSFRIANALWNFEDRATPARRPARRIARLTETAPAGAAASRCRRPALRRQYALYAERT